MRHETTSFRIRGFAPQPCGAFGVKNESSPARLGVGAPGISRTA